MSELLKTSEIDLGGVQALTAEGAESAQAAAVAAAAEAIAAEAAADVAFEAAATAAAAVSVATAAAARAARRANQVAADAATAATSAAADTAQRNSAQAVLTAEEVATFSSADQSVAAEAAATTAATVNAAAAAAALAVAKLAVGVAAAAAAAAAAAVEAATLVQAQLSGSAAVAAYALEHAHPSQASTVPLAFVEIPAQYLVDLHNLPAAAPTRPNPDLYVNTVIGVAPPAAPMPGRDSLAEARMEQGRREVLSALANDRSSTGGGDNVLLRILERVTARMNGDELAHIAIPVTGEYFEHPFSNTTGVDPLA